MKKNKSRQTKLVFDFLFFIFLSILALPIFLKAQPRTEYRAFWVDTFNTTLNNHTDVVNVVNNAKATKANAIFAQVRRRGDAWYLKSLEPAPDFTAIAADFDPLKDLIIEAHANGIEVHAFVIMGAIWNKNPTFAPSATLGPPTNANHVFNRHGGYDSATKKIIPGPDNWLTRTLLPDGSAGISFQGHRFGNDFWLDFGHPDAAAHSVDVLKHLVEKYQIDGLHLDRIRYPEFNLAGQTPTTGANIGYNVTSIERFQRHNGIPLGSPPPAAGNPQWMQWRRDQVTNLVRRVYLNAIAIRPQIKVSAALIAFGGGPSCPTTTTCADDTEIWQKAPSAEAYWRVYQDWRAWTEEGILDIAIPMNYKREHIAAQATQYNQWNEWTKNHQYNRAAMIGQGAFLNAIEGTLRQTRRALAPSATGNSGIGVLYFSMATSNVRSTTNGTTDVVNPHSFPQEVTPIRSFAEFASGLTTGKSVNGFRLYEDPMIYPAAIFAETAAIPTLSWKTAPTKGHLMGFAKRSDDTVLDTAAVTITDLASGNARSTATDGGGFYGGVDLTPGEYLVKAVLNNETLYSCVANVSAGTVTTANLQPEMAAPATSAVLNPSMPNGTNNWYTSDVVVNLSASDNCSGVATTEYSLDGANWMPYNDSILISDEGATTISYRSTDRAGNIETVKTVTVQIDKTIPTINLSANPNRIFPPNGQSVTVTLSGVGSDAISSLASVSYAVIDEYGTTLNIPTRTLSGKSTSWTDSIIVEARRHGDDLDGRLYRISATITDTAGNTTTVITDIVVQHDQGNQ